MTQRTPTLRVFSDTGALLAMLVFPRSREGRLTLAGEVLELHRQGRFDLVISQAVVDELEEVTHRAFPAYRPRVTTLLASLASRFTRWPTPQEIAEVLPYATDPGDAPIFAAAVIARPDVVLSNDFHSFHSPVAMPFWKGHGITVESLYGLLCLFGRRERKPE